MGNRVEALMHDGPNSGVDACQSKMTASQSVRNHGLIQAGHFLLQNLSIS